MTANELALSFKFTMTPYELFLLINIIIIIILVSTKGISDTEGEEKNWLENVYAGMTISPRLLLLLVLVLLVR